MARLKNINTGVIIDAELSQRNADLGYVPVGANEKMGLVQEMPLKNEFATSLPATNVNNPATPSTSAITSESLQETTPFQLPKTTAEPNYQSIMWSIPTIESIVSAQPTEAATKQDDLTTRLEQAYAKISGKKPYTAQAEEQAGLYGYQTQLKDVNAQLQSLQKEAAAIPLQIQEEAKGRGVTAAGVAPIEAGRLRQNTIKALGLSAIAQTLQGNISMAQEQANRAVELEFAPAEAEIEYLEKALELNKDKLTREEQKQAAVQEAKLAERKEQIANEKENKSVIMGFAAEAKKNGASTALITQAMALSNPQEALVMLADYLTDPMEKQQALIDMQYKQAQTQKLVAEAEAKGEPVVQQVGNTLLQYNPDINQWEIIFSAPKDGTLSISDQIKLKSNGYSLDESGNLVKISSPTLNSNVILIDEILSSPYLGQIFGMINPLTYWTPGSNEQLVKSQVEQLKSNLSLENRTMLKGSGQISDFEAKMLEKASTALNRKLSDKDAKKVLEDIRTDFKLMYDLQNEFPSATQEEIESLFNEERSKKSFNKVGSDTNPAVKKALNVSTGTEAGQCGRFVNKYTGLGLGDSYKSKISKMDSSITYPEPGMVFVMPYKDTGHTGFIQSVNNDGTVTVKDSNWSKDEKVQTHKIAISKITGLRRV